MITIMTMITVSSITGTIMPSMIVTATIATTGSTTSTSVNTGGGFTPHPDGQGGQFLEGTFELTILDATGVYRAFKGGHNHMVDKLHKLADGRFDELCFCIISQYQFP